MKDTIYCLFIVISSGRWRLLMKYETLCAIWCHLYNFKKVKNTHKGVLYLVK